MTTAARTAVTDPSRHLRRTSDAILDLSRRHPAWATSVDGDDPLYALPTATIDVLARRTGRGTAPLFDRPTAEAEREFSRLCAAHHIVGIGPSGTIPYPHLTTAPPDPDEERSVAESPANRVAAINRRLLGAVGYLVTEPAYLQEIAAVRREYERLPDGGRPRFPLGPRSWLPGDLDDGAYEALATALQSLLARWGLACLAAWDLPVPQGPHLPDLIPLRTVARPAHGVLISIPIHYGLQEADDLRQLVSEAQQRQAADLGVAAGYAAITRYATYGQMFRVLHLEAAIRRRFPDPPRGLIGVTEVAVGEGLCIGAERVHRLRSWIRACRAGNRHLIADLRPAA